MRALAQLAHGEKVPDCTKCRGEPRLREQYGCDGPAVIECHCRGRGACDACGGLGRVPKTVFEIHCSQCDGKGWKDVDVPCGACNGGKVPMFRCPLKLCEEHDSGRALQRTVWYVNRYPVLPSSGGLGDQSAPFIELLGIYEGERNLIARDNSPEAKKQRQIEAAKRRAGIQ